MRKTPIVIGMSYGDEGKGTTVDYLCSEHQTNFVVRFCGGPQAAHNVVTPDGRHHTFSQFGSGTFKGAGTILTAGMMINPLNMVAEAEHLIEVTGVNPFFKTLINGKCLMITDVHRQANRQRELNRGIDRHGSCGEGIGETKAFYLYHPVEAPRIEDMASPGVLRAKLEKMASLYMEEIDGFVYEVTDSMMEDFHNLYEDIFGHITMTEKELNEIIKSEAEQGLLVFEGSQGILLDEAHGFHPNTTWSDVTSRQALKVLSDVGIERDQVKQYGVLRTYSTRHGDGPFPTEFIQDNWMKEYPELHNTYGEWQGDFRGGMFDLELAKYAFKANDGFDAISLTHCDKNPDKIIESYVGGFPEPSKNFDRDIESHRDYRGKISEYAKNISTQDMNVKQVNVDELISLIETHLAPVEIRSYGVTHLDKEVLRNESLQGISV